MKGAGTTGQRPRVKEPEALPERRRALGVSTSLQRLIEASAPYWGAEAEVCRTYFASPRRSAESERVWLERQMYKEYWEGFHRPFASLTAYLEQSGNGFAHGEALALGKLAYEELTHYCAFADV